ncbi:MAG: Tim44/TimA family putative adaptor protein [Hyphomonadaceae bacterium]|nr:Tim44/TimA family putative adaptor protein [Hyphomonadaceae bacterium]
MDQGLIEILILAFVAGFVLFRLYTTLGRRTGSERPASPTPAPAQGEFSSETPSPVRRPVPAPSGPAGEGLLSIVRADPSFDVEHFVVGARGAYELIVNAFAKGDREALGGLLTPRVFESYSAAIAQRESSGGTGPELVRLRTAEVVDASLEGEMARVVVKFEAELAEGAHGVREARERWTFERNVRSADPNWLLARVSAA